MIEEEKYFEEVFEPVSKKFDLPLRPLLIWGLFVLIALVLCGINYENRDGFSASKALFFITSAGLFGSSLAWFRYSLNHSSQIVFIFIISALLFSGYIFYEFFTFTSRIPITYLGSYLIWSGAFFTIYEFYKKSILKRKEELGNGIIAIRQESNSRRNLYSFLSAIACFFGIGLATINLFPGIVVIFLSLLGASYRKGLDINCNTKQFKFHKRYFWFKAGKWQKYSSDYELIVATPIPGELGKFKSEFYTEGRIKRAHLFLVNESEKSKVLLYRFKRDEIPFKEAQELADKMNVVLMMG